MGGYIFISDDSAGLTVIDVIDPENPVDAVTVDTPGRARGVATDTGFVFVADHEGGLRVIRVF